MGSIPLTTMRVISVEDEGDSVTVVTMRPSTEVTDMNMEGSGNSDATTTMQPIMEDDPDQDIIPFPSDDSQDSTTASTTDQDQLSTTTSSTSEETTPSTEDDQESSATDDSVDASGDLPMSCKHMDGDEDKTVMLLIPKEVLGDISLTRLFDKNVKIVVKDFMIMDRSPRRLL